MIDTGELGDRVRRQAECGVFMAFIVLIVLPRTTDTLHLARRAATARNVRP